MTMWFRLSVPHLFTRRHWPVSRPWSRLLGFVLILQLLSSRLHTFKKVAEIEGARSNSRRSEANVQTKVSSQFNHVLQVYGRCASSPRAASCGSSAAFLLFQGLLNERMHVAPVTPRTRLELLDGWTRGGHDACFLHSDAVRHNHCGLQTSAPHSWLCDLSHIANSVTTWLQCEQWGLQVCVQSCQATQQWCTLAWHKMVPDRRFSLCWGSWDLRGVTSRCSSHQWVIHEQQKRFGVDLLTCSQHAVSCDLSSSKLQVVSEAVDYLHAFQVALCTFRVWSSSARINGNKDPLGSVYIHWHQQSKKVNQRLAKHDTQDSYSATASSARRRRRW